MATKSVVHYVNDSTTQAGGLNLSRPEKVYVSFGRIPSTGYAINDTLKFDSIAARDIIYARFKAVTTGQALEVYSGTDLTDALGFFIQDAGQPDSIDYVIHYVHGESLKVIQLHVKTDDSSSSSDSSNSSSSSDSSNSSSSSSTSSDSSASSASSNSSSSSSDSSNSSSSSSG